MKKQILYRQLPIAYEISGNGPCLLLQHGFCEDSNTWRAFRAHFESNFTLITPDMPGFGDSAAQADFSVEMMAEIINMILEAEGVESCHLVGHSMGGYVAMAFAEKYASKLDGLCLFHSHPFADSPEKQQNRQKTIEFMERWGVPAFVKELVPKLFSKDFVAEEPAFIQEFISNASAYTQDAMIAATRAMIQRPDRSGVLKELDCPVFFIVGALDETIPKDFSEAQFRLPKRVTAVILDNVAHMGMFEAEAQCMDALEAWMN